MASASRWVNISILLASVAGAGTGPSIPLLVGSSTRLPVSSPLRVYSSLSGVASDFQTTDPEYIAAQVFFAQTPCAATLWIGRKFASATAAQLACGALTATQQTISRFTAIGSTGSCYITLDGVQRTLSGINLSAVASMDNVATAITAVLNAAVAGAACTWSASTSQFLITGATTGGTATISVLSPTGSGNDISALIAGTAATGAQIFNGVAADTNMTATLTRLAAYKKGWTGVTLTADATNTDLTNAAAYCQAYKILFFYTLQDANALLTGNTSNLGYTFQQAGYSMAHGVYSGQNAYAVLAVMSREFSVDFNGQNTTITMWGKTLTGVAPDSLNDTQLAALEAINVNYYTTVTESSGAVVSMYAQGTQADGTYLDTQHGLIWLNQASQTAVFEAMRGQTTKLPKTDKGVDVLVKALEGVLNQAVRNGLAAPGTYTGVAFGNIAPGTVLDKGYYAYAAPIASSVGLGARQSPPIQAVLIGAGALQSVNVTITFQGS